MKFSAIIISIGILIVGTTLFFAIQYSDGVVTNDYYEKGLDYDLHQKNKEKFGLDLEIKNIQKDNGEVTITYKLNTKEGISPEKLTVAVVRPGTAFETYKIDIKNINNLYTLSFNTKNKGHFLLKNNFYIGDNLINLKKNFYVN